MPYAPLPTHRVEVHLLGEFAISIDGRSTDSLKGRTKRVWLLVEYLLANRARDIPLEELIDMLWENDMCGDPMNALKNLVYRARTLLNGLAGDPCAEFILFSGGVYAWNNAYSCTIDCEELEKCWKSAQSSEKPENTVAACREVLRLYKGAFLPKSSYRTWAVARAAYFSTLHNNAVLRLCNALLEKGAFDEAVSVCEHALTIAPLDEAIHKLLLRCYVGSGQIGRASKHYNHAVSHFYRELGVDVSAELRAVFSQLGATVQSIETDLDVIKNDLKEAAATQCAYFCDYSVFKNLYRVQERAMPRTGHPAFIALFTVTAADGGAPSPEVLKLATQRLKNAMLKNLRLGDVVAAYSLTQYIVMLPLVTFENAELVCDRVLRRFHYDYRTGAAQVSVKLAALSD